MLFNVKFKGQNQTFNGASEEDVLKKILKSCREKYSNYSIKKNYENNSLVAELYSKNSKHFEKFVIRRKYESLFSCSNNRRYQ